ncbi:sphingomyelin phosphodiesterase [Vibrio campbellii]|uniref:Sphingomyelin phosphodiesterase n=1 Tax=Vibrio campbellii TaxID=680 RepID=A0AAQ2Y390_9VIBR|nr:sphingomyelin phosphodiesterase [Vibrio campbellii]WDG11268.1 sphingomyelin phosphodiesterase [Vibrio campbellii]
MMRTLTIATLLWAMTFQALATSVYYINRTSEAIRVNFVVDTTEPVENGYQYRAPSEQVIILPYERVKVADFNRYYGIVNGATYDYYMHVDRQNGQDGGWVEERETPIAQLRLVGHGAGTTLSYGYKRLVLKGDYDPYVTEVNRGDGRHAEFGAKAVYTSGFDDVEFVIAEHDIADMEYREHVLQVATYNLWMIPSVSSDIAARAAMMEQNLSGYDVLALQEAFSSYREPMFDALSDEYPYRTDVVGGDSNAMYDGGVVTLSRYPILESDALVFDHCSGTDCYADKGIVYTKIDKNGEIYHIFNTHLASFDTREAKRLRRLQLGLLRTFMLTKQIPADEAVVYAGDFNIDKNSDFMEYLLMLATLEVDPPAYLGYTPATFEPKINAYASANYSGGEKSEYLDYVLVSSEHRRAFENTNTVKLRQRVTEDTWGEWHLSDHFSVVGNFVFDERN